MPRKLTSTQFDALAQRLERMADGIAKHNNDQDFPARLDQAKRRFLRQQLEDLRARWESLMAEADRAYDAYFAHFTLCTTELAKDDDTLRGHYGKSNPSLMDYGTKVILKPLGRKKKPAKQP